MSDLLKAAGWLSLLVLGAVGVSLVYADLSDGTKWTVSIVLVIIAGSWSISRFENETRAYRQKSLAELAELKRSIDRLQNQIRQIADRSDRYGS